MKFLQLPKRPVELPSRGTFPRAVHLFDRRSVDAINAALASNRPLLVRGDPGTGKSQLARAAAEAFRPALADMQPRPFGARVLSNYTGDFYAEPDELREHLYRQLNHPVLWYRCMQRALDEGADTIIELGGGLGTGGPADKRPNLADVTKQCLKRSEREARYLPGINVATLRESAAAL